MGKISRITVEFEKGQIAVLDDEGVIASVPCSDELMEDVCAYMIGAIIEELKRGVKGAESWLKRRGA
jgi:hypothetical protein